MNTSVAITFVLIVLARITDMTLDTIRTASIVQGRRMFSAILGFFQAVIYILAIAKVLLNMDNPVYALAYGLGFALGTFLWHHHRAAPGLRAPGGFALHKERSRMANALIAAGHRLAEVHGHIRDGEASILYVEVPRKQATNLIRDAGAVDKTCFCIVNDVRVARFAARQKAQAASASRPGGRRLGTFWGIHLV